MILNKDKLLNYLVSWLKDYVKQSGMKELVALRYKNDLPLVELCKLTRLPYQHEEYTTINDVRYNNPHALILGGSSKENCLFRSYEKGKEGDLIPFGDLYYSEIIELFSIPDSIINSLVSKRHVGLLTNFDIEWADRQEALNNIISSEEDPTKHPAWLGYTLNQRKLIAKLHQREKLTRHKVNNNIPICKVRHIEGLVI